MTVVRFLTDEHVPGPCITVLRSIGYDVLRAKDEFREGTEDGVLLEFASETDRIVLTCDKRFTIVEGDRVRTHAGVIYADQATLQCQPEDVAGAIGRIVSTVPAEEMRAAEFYVNDWM
jgi:uncharacterized protein with PIN domain